MRRHNILVLVLSLVVVGSGVNAAFSQDYPNKPIRIVTSGQGGGADFASRLIAQGLLTSMGQPVIVDNRSTGAIPGEVVARAASDGYTLLLDAASIWIGGLLQETHYDPIRDFSPITVVEKSPFVLVVTPSLPVNSVKDLIALAKAKPGTLNYGFGATGGSVHLATELFNYMAGVNIVRISFKGGGPLYTAVISGEVQFTLASAGGAMPHIKSGRMRALAVSSSKPSVLFPGLPTIAASGVPGYEWAFTQGVLAPGKTPAAIVTRINQEIVRVLNTQDVKDKFFNAGVDAVSSSPEEFASLIKSDVAKMSKLIRDVGIRAE